MEFENEKNKIIKIFYDREEKILNFCKKIAFDLEEIKTIKQQTIDSQENINKINLYLQEFNLNNFVNFPENLQNKYNLKSKITFNNSCKFIIEDLKSKIIKSNHIITELENLKKQNIENYEKKNVEINEKSTELSNFHYNNFKTNENKLQNEYIKNIINLEYKAIDDYVLGFIEYIYNNYIKQNRRILYLNFILIFGLLFIYLFPTFIPDIVINNTTVLKNTVNRFIFLKYFILEYKLLYFLLTFFDISLIIFLGIKNSKFRKSIKILNPVSILEYKSIEKINAFNDCIINLNDLNSYDILKEFVNNMNNEHRKNLILTQDFKLNENIFELEFYDNNEFDYNAERNKIQQNYIYDLENLNNNYLIENNKIINDKKELLDDNKLNYEDSLNKIEKNIKEVFPLIEEYNSDIHNFEKEYQTLIERVLLSLNNKYNNNLIPKFELETNEENKNMHDFLNNKLLYFQLFPSLFSLHTDIKQNDIFKYVFAWQICIENDVNLIINFINTFPLDDEKKEIIYSTIQEFWKDKNTNINIKDKFNSFFNFQANSRTKEVDLKAIKIDLIISLREVLNNNSIHRNMDEFDQFKIGKKRHERNLTNNILGNKNNVKPFIKGLIEVPIIIDFINKNNLLFEFDSINVDNKQKINQHIDHIIAKQLLTIKLKKIKFIFIDPIDLGGNFKNFTPLHKDFWGGEFYCKPREISDVIDRLIRIFQNVQNKYLHNEFATLKEYNIKNKDVNEPYYFVVIYDFPEGFTDETLKLLIKIIKNGPKVGIHVILVANKNKPISNSYKSLDCEQFLEETKNNFINYSNLFSELKFKFDTLFEPVSIKELVNYTNNILPLFDIDSVDFESHTDINKEITWNETAYEKLTVDIGKSGSEIQKFELNNKEQSQGILIGKPGSGKSNLLHVIICSLIYKYSPADVEIHLIDFKEGVEFNFYNQKIPHIKTLAIEANRSYGFEILDLIYKQFEQRGEEFKNKNARSIEEYHQKEPNKKIPRIFLIIDEFQEFFKENDHIKQQVETIFDFIIRKGRSLGINMLLSTQSLTRYSLQESTLHLIGLRMSMMTSKDNGDRLFDSNNKAYLDIIKVGQGLYNSENGMSRGNSFFQTFLIDESTIIKIINKVTNHYNLNKDKYPNISNSKIFAKSNFEAEAKKDYNYPEIKFDTYALNLEDFLVFKNKLQIKIPIGINENEIQFFYLDFENYNNVLIIGNQGSGKTNLLHTIINGIITNYPPAFIQLDVIDLNGKHDYTIYDDKIPHIKNICLEQNELFTLEVLKNIEQEIKHLETLFLNNKVKNIYDYNKLVNEEKTANPNTTLRYIPYQILIIDEFEFLFKPNSEHRINILNSLENIMNKAKYYGINFIITVTDTQKLSVNKFNFNFFDTFYILKTTKEMIQNIISLDEIQMSNLLYSGQCLSNNLTKANRNNIINNLKIYLIKNLNIEANIKNIKEYCDKPDKKDDTILQQIPFVYKKINTDISNQKILLDLSKLCNEKKLWKKNAIYGIEIPIGISFDDSLLHNFILGKKNEEDKVNLDNHCFIGGTSGMGKTVFLHRLILDLCLNYSPEEINLFLFDWKGGTSFNCYSSLPHVTVSVLSENLDFTLSALNNYLFRKIKSQRDRLFKEHNVKDYEEFRRNINYPLPRVIIIFDEMSNLLSVSNYPFNEQIRDKINEIVRIGRSYGIHIILCTQNALELNPKPTLSNITRRYAFYLKDPAASEFVIGEGLHRKRATELKKPGEVFFKNNDAHNRINVEFVSDEEKFDLISKIILFYNEKLKGKVFDKYIADDLPPSFLTENNSQNDKIYIGVPCLITHEKAYFKLNLSRNFNFLIIGKDVIAAFQTIVLCIYQMLIKYTPQSTYYIFNFYKPNKTFYNQINSFSNLNPKQIKVIQKNNFFKNLLLILDELYKRKKLLNESNSTENSTWLQNKIIIYLFNFPNIDENQGSTINSQQSNNESSGLDGSDLDDLDNIINMEKAINNIHNIDFLNPERNLNNSSTNLIKQPLINQQVKQKNFKDIIIELAKDGPEHGIHLVIQTESKQELFKIFDNHLLNNFDIKLALNGGESTTVLKNTQNKKAFIKQNGFAIYQPDETITQNNFFLIKLFKSLVENPTDENYFNLKSIFNFSEEEDNLDDPFM